MYKLAEPTTASDEHELVQEGPRLKDTVKIAGLQEVDGWRQPFKTVRRGILQEA